MTKSEEQGVQEYNKIETLTEDFEMFIAFINIFEIIWLFTFIIQQMFCEIPMEKPKPPFLALNNRVNGNR